LIDALGRGADRRRAFGGPVSIVILVHRKLTAGSIPADGDPQQFIQADVSTRGGADHVIKAIFDRLGGLDILINGAGGSSAPVGGALALSDGVWQQEFELNLFSAVRLNRGFLPAMIKQGSGVVVYVSSIQRTLPAEPFPQSERSRSVFRPQSLSQWQVAYVCLRRETTGMFLKSLGVGQ